MEEKKAQINRNEEGRGIKRNGNKNGWKKVKE
jgi:hypothetical protein